MTNYAEQRYKIEYTYNGINKTVIAKTTEEKERIHNICKKDGYNLNKTTKLYPFSTNKNQHNFMLVMNRCNNKMYDMDMGYIPYNKKEYDRLYELAQKAEKYYCLELPIAWVDGRTYGEANRIAHTAIEYRVNTCINNDRYDLLKYCY